MSGIARFAAVTLDCSNAKELAAFYHKATGMELVHSDDNGAYLDGGDGVALAIQRVDDYKAPEWPSQKTPQQLHLDLAVTDLDAAERQLLEIGATKPESQPEPDKWRVLLDPAGHPFCAAIF